MKQLDRKFFVEKIKELAGQLGVELGTFTLAIQYMLEECEAYMFLEDFSNAITNAIEAKQLPATEVTSKALNELLDCIYGEDNESPLLHKIRYKKYQMLVDATGYIVTKIYDYEEN